MVRPSGIENLPSGETSGVRIALETKCVMNAAPTPGTDGNIPSTPPNPRRLQPITPTNWRQCCR